MSSQARMVTLRGRWVDDGTALGVLASIVCIIAHPSGRRHTPEKKNRSCTLESSSENDRQASRLCLQQFIDRGG